MVMHSIVDAAPAVCVGTLFPVFLKGTKVTGLGTLVPSGLTPLRAQTCHMTSATPTSAHDQEPEVSRSKGAVATERSPGVQGGDLARRVTHRRTELGLSTEELARQAGVDAWFLAYFEQSSDSTLTGGALLRLAVALDTTPSRPRGWWGRPPAGSGPCRAAPRARKPHARAVRRPSRRWRHRSDRAVHRIRPGRLSGQLRLRSTDASSSGPRMPWSPPSRASSPSKSTTSTRP